MNTITKEGVLEYFYEISRHPRPSGSEEKISRYIHQWATDRWYTIRQDKAGNLVVNASGNMKSDLGTLGLQWHLDMVCVADENSQIDPTKDPLDLYEEDWVLRARGTTLWADNGIWVAMMLAAADLADRPDLELIFTLDEERGLVWASQIDPSIVSSNNILNLDNEMNHEVCIGTAGLGTLEASIPIVRIEPESGMTLIRLVIDGLEWGHSGVDIHKPHGNALLLAAEILHTYAWEYQLVWFEGWVADNAIPSRVQMDLYIDDIEWFFDFAGENLESFQDNHHAPAAHINVSPNEETIQPMKDADSIIKSVLEAGTWVVDFFEKLDSKVTTSYNLAIVSTVDNSLEITYSVRSFHTDKLQEILDKIASHYPQWTSHDDILHGPWSVDENGEFVQKLTRSMNKVTWKAYTSVIHAGLEAAILDEVIPHAQVTSIGPVIHFPHSTNEHIYIQDIETYCLYLQQIIADWVGE